MSETVSNLVSQVRTREEAEQVVRSLLLEWTTDVAFERVKEEGYLSKQSPVEVVKRVTGNLFRSFTLRRR